MQRNIPLLLQLLFLLQLLLVLLLSYMLWQGYALAFSNLTEPGYKHGRLIKKMYQINLKWLRISRRSHFLHILHKLYIRIWINDFVIMYTTLVSANLDIMYIKCLKWRRVSFSNSLNCANSQEILFISFKISL